MVYNRTEILKEQQHICTKYNTEYQGSSFEQIIGVSLNIKDGVLPLNGLRHSVEGNTSGWYVWAGEEYSEEPDFFVPLHIEHLEAWCPLILKYLGLPSGWRFLVTPNYEDVWFDESLLNWIEK